MQKLSLQLACRYFADSNIFIAESWCFGALVISLYLLTWGGKDKCALQYLLHLHTYKRLLLGGCFGFLTGFEVMVLISFWLQCFWCNWFFHTQLLCGLELFWEHVSKQIWFQESTWAGWKAEMPSLVGTGRLCPSPGTPGCPGAALCLRQRNCRYFAGIARMTSMAVTWICQICIENMWTCLKYYRVPL